MLCKVGLLCLMLLVGLGTIVRPCHAQSFEGTHLSSTDLPYGTPPYKFEGSRLISITFRTSPAIVQAIVPKPLLANQKGIMSIVIGEQKIVDPMRLSYHEAIILVPVSYAGAEGNYLPVLYLDKDVPIIAGREIYGYSKFEAEIHLKEDDTRIHATVTRDGTTLIDAILSRVEPAAPNPMSPSTPTFNLKLIPSVAKDGPPDVMQLTSTTIGKRVVRDFRTGKATLTFGSTPSDPLGAIPVLEIISGSYSERDFVLDYGRVVYDYLTAGKGISRVDK